MSNQLPANFAAFLTLLAGQQANLGAPNPRLDGTSAFTISGWFRVPDTDTKVMLVQGQLLSFSFVQRRPTVTMGDNVLQLPYQLEAGRFCQFAAIYTPGESGSGTLQFYAYGALVGETLVSLSSAAGPQSLLVGDLESSVVMRRLWLTDEALAADQVVETRYGATGSAPFSVQSTWDYGQIPAAIIGAPTPVLPSGATQSVATPGLSAGSSGLATLSLTGASTTSQGTLQGWFYFPPVIDGSSIDVAQTLVSVSGPEGAIYIQATPQSNGTWQLMAGNFGNLSFGKIGVELSGWHNLALTWSSDAMGIIYLDGQLLVQDLQASLTLTPTTVTVGNASQPTTGSAFVGLVQGVTVWDVALPGSDIQAHQLPYFPTTDTDPIAALDFSVSPAIDLVSGVQPSLQGGAVVQLGLSTTDDVQPNPQMLVTTRKRPSLAGLEPQNPPTVSPAVYSAEREAELVAEIQGYMAKAPGDAQLQAEGAKQIELLRQRFEAGRAGNPDLTGIVHSELQGDEWITFYYGENGPEAIARQSRASASPCTMWMIDFVATACLGLLGIMGVPLSTGVAVKAIQKLLGKAAIWEAIAKVLEETITTSTIIGILQAFYDGGGLMTFVKAVLDNVSWWDFLWMVADVFIELVGLLVPGVEEALVLAKCVVLAGQLGVKFSQRPSGCPG